MFIYENEVEEEESREFEEEIKFDSSEEEIETRKPSNTIHLSNQKPSGSINSNSRIQVRSTISIKKPGRKIKNENSQFMAEL